MPGPEFPHRPHRHLLLHRRGKGQRNGVAPGNLPRLVCGRLPNPDDLLAGLAEMGPGGSQPHMGRAAGKEGRPQFLLQYLDLAGDSRLGHIVFFRRLGEAQAVGNTQKIAQLLQGHLQTSSFPLFCFSIPYPGASCTWFMRFCYNVILLFYFHPPSQYVKILTAENKKRFCLQWLYSRQIRRAPREGPPDLHAFTRRKEDFREKFHFAPQFLESRCCRRTGSGSPGFHGRLCKQQHRRILFGRHLYPRHLFGNRKRHRPGYRDHDL